MSKILACLVALAILSSSTVQSSTLDIYTESLCPDTTMFLLTQLLNYISLPCFEQLNTEVNLIPFGKATQTYHSENKTWTYTCQHGPEECRGNLLQACTLHLNPNKRMAMFQFICINGKRTDEIRKGCFDDPNLFERVKACAESEEGSTLMHEIAEKTLSKKPSFIPMFILDNEYDRIRDQDFRENFVKNVICLPENQEILPSCIPKDLTFTC